MLQGIHVCNGPCSFLVLISIKIETHVCSISKNNTLLCNYSSYSELTVGMHGA